MSSLNLPCICLIIVGCPEYACHEEEHSSIGKEIEEKEGGELQTEVPC